jgi:FkbM family methyltransferase
MSYTVNIKNTGKMVLVPYEFVDRQIFIFNEYEPEIVRALNLILKEGDNFLDIGANIGYMSLVASAKVKTFGHVYAFEAFPEMADRLKQNVELNHRSNITIYSSAVSNRIEMVSFYPNYDGNSGMSSMLKGNGRKKIDVPALTIDSLLNELPPITLIKMDIEGAEGSALEGMVNLILRDTPVIIMELTDEYLGMMGSSAEKVVNKIRSFDYTVWELVDHLKFISSAPTYQCDIICIHKSNDDIINAFNRK